MKKPRTYQYFAIEQRLAGETADNPWTVRDSAPTLKAARNIKKSPEAFKAFEYRLMRVVQLVEEVPSAR